MDFVVVFVLTVSACCAAAYAQYRRRTRQPVEAAAGQAVRLPDARSSNTAKRRSPHWVKFLRVWRLVRKNYLWTARLVAWESWRERYRGCLKTPQEAEQAIVEMLSSLNDNYTHYQDRAATAQEEAEEKRESVVSYRVLPGKIGYVKIDTFSSNHAAQETAQALQALSNARGYILDLRDNPGGSDEQDFPVFSMFADSGVYCRFRGRKRSQITRFVLGAKWMEVVANGKLVSRKVRYPNYTGNKPLAILVNEETASAAENLAGSLCVVRHAAVFGTRTYGKGVVTDTWSLKDETSVQIVTAWFTVTGGYCPHRMGITPTHFVAGKRRVRQAAYRWVCAMLDKRRRMA